MLFLRPRQTWTRAWINHNRPRIQSTSSRSNPVDNSQLALSDGERAIYDKLQAKFSPSKLEVQDISGGCGTFYAIGITSSAFEGLPIVKQHRMVNSELKAEIEGIHGLQLKTAAE